ncbi:enoyl-CoA hydratase/isomerase family protein [Aliiruegeria sabulilitoris]|uniref:enoyl-CoA hydratase/isomerase family protein n=1 Tax=Aliiruegeria sabulilitoris TaxID=1510458 RepID=UPI00082990E4|nr:enoyl-CoA hydratase/isomerase family protein [Aliiruegeria sabulilitoris]NDR58550.1 enoyl-CoA hydratase/isomerase family protein [Pseudoruegeria sp. M32A2M]
MIDVIRETQGEAQVWTLRINRPDKANSLTRDMLRAVETATAEAEQAGVAALVLTGEGKVFSAGADLEEARAGLATDGIWERVSSRIASMPCLTIAALNGTLAGGAFGMALACDLRVAVPEARFFYPVMKLGFLPQPSDPGRLAALIGPARARMILMASQKIDAATACDWGLVDRIVEKEALAETVNALSEAVCAAPPEIRKGIKAMIPG